MEHKPGFVGILCWAERGILDNLPVDLALQMINGLLPNGNITLFHKFFPAKALCYILNNSLFSIQIPLGSFPSFPVPLPVNGRAGENPKSTGSKNSINFNQVGTIYSTIHPSTIASELSTLNKHYTISTKLTFISYVEMHFSTGVKYGIEYNL